MPISLNLAITLQYVSFVVLVLACVHSLFKRAGCCFLAIYSLCMGVQMSMLFGFLPDFNQLRAYHVSEEAMVHLALGIVVYNTVASLLLIFIFRGVSKSKVETPPLVLRPGMITILSVLAVAFVVARLNSGGGQLVLQGGVTTLGGFEYYSVRAELIEVGLSSYSRLTNQFTNISRKLLLVAMLVLAASWVKQKKLLHLVLALCCYCVLLVDEILRFQKAPIVVNTIALLAPFLVYKQNLRHLMLIRGPIIILCACAVSLGIIKVTQGITGKDALYLLTGRMFLIPDYASAMHFEVYPEIKPYVRFTGMRTVAKFLGEETAPEMGSIALEVARTLTGQTYNANAGLIATAWANGGFLGIIFITALCAILGYAIDRRLIAARNRVDIKPMLIFLWLPAINYGNNAFENVVNGHALWLIPFIYPVLFGPRPDALTTGRGPQELQKPH
jgi:hypothetical protein